MFHQESFRHPENFHEPYESADKLIDMLGPSIAKVDRRALVRSLSEYLLSLGLVISGLIILRFANDLYLWNQLFSGDQAGIPVGKIVVNEGQARRRPVGSVVWHDIKAKTQDVTEGDSLFTSDNGESELQLPDMTIKLAPNSLIVVQANPKAPSTKSWLDGLKSAFVKTQAPAPAISLKQGSMEVKLKTPASRADLVLNNKHLQISTTSSNQAVKIQAQEQTDNQGVNQTEMRVTANQGHQVSIQDVNVASAPSLQVSADHAIEFRDQSALKEIPVFFELAKPSPQERILSASSDETSPVHFSWKQRSQKELAASTQLEIIGTEKITLPITMSSSLSGETHLPLHAGPYQWRLTSITQDGREVSTSWSPFKLSMLRPPQGLGPADQSIFDADLKKKTAALQFIWDAPTDSASVEAQISDKQSLEGAKIESIEGAVLRKELASGDYWWRVRTKTASGQVSAWSRPRSLTIETPVEAGRKTAGAEIMNPVLAVPAAAPVIAEPAAASVAAPVTAPVPVPVVPVKKVVEQLPSFAMETTGGSTELDQDANLTEVGVELRWKPVPGVNEYHLTVFDHDSMMTEETIQTPRYKLMLTSLEQKGLSYQVGVTLPSGTAVLSDKFPIHLVFSSPIPKSPPNGSVHVAKEGITFSWAKTALTDHYEFELSRDASLSKVEFNESSDRNYYLFSPTQAGNYFWRVRSIYKNKGPSKWTQIHNFKVR